MEESIKTIVIVGEEEKELEIATEDDACIFKLDGKEIFSLDYSENLVPMINRIKEMWGN